MKKPSLLERLRAKKQAKSFVVGVTWYTEENWERVKSTATDPERFEATYAEWNAMAIKALADIKRSGVNAIEFFVNSDDFQAWCMLHNKPNRADSRAEFVSERVRSQYELELSVTPADSLRLWQASGEADDGVKNGDEPVMQAGKWGAAANAMSGVRSNATLDSDRKMSDILCTFLLPVGGQQPAKKSRK